MTIAYKIMPFSFGTPLESATYAPFCGHEGVLHVSNEALERVLPTVISLVAGGADVNETWRDGRTPLMAAVTTENLELTRYLLEKGANVNASNPHSRGQTVLMYATDDNKLRFHNACKIENDIVRLLLRYGADVHAKDKLGYTALSYVQSSGTPDWARILVDAGADVNSRSISLHSYPNEPILITALRWSARHRDDARSEYSALDLVRLLVKRGADVNLRDDSGRTALMYSFYAGREQLNIVDLLLQAGADINASANDGHTLWIAGADGPEWLAQRGSIAALQYFSKRQRREEADRHKMEVMRSRNDKKLCALCGHPLGTRRWFMNLFRVPYLIFFMADGEETYKLRAHKDCGGFRE